MQSFIIASLLEWVVDAAFRTSNKYSNCGFVLMLGCFLIIVIHTCIFRVLDYNC